MNPSTLAEARAISGKVRRAAAKLNNVEVVVCPPFPFIQACTPRIMVKNYGIGAQSVSDYQDGAHTGEVGASMLKDLNIRYSIVGHSEQRARGDGDLIVRDRAKAALERGIIPVICVGEISRDENGAYLEKLKGQIKGSLTDIPKKFAGNMVIAYEPVWAIGGQEAMKPEDVHETSLFVRKIFADLFGQENGLKVKVLYGGSVNRRNAADIVKIGKVNGLLVGHESANPAGFTELLKIIDII